MKYTKTEFENVYYKEANSFREQSLLVSLYILATMPDNFDWPFEKTLTQALEMDRNRDKNQTD